MSKFGKMERLRQCVFALMCIRGFVGHVAGENTNGVEFLYPTENLTFHYMDTVNVTYTSEFPTPQLWVFCTNASDVTASLITEEKRSAPAFNASMLMQIDYVGGSPCWFDLKPNNSAGHGRNSPQFVVNPSPRATPITIGLDDLTSSSTSTPPSTSTSHSATTSTSASTTDRSKSNTDVAATGTGTGTGTVASATSTPNSSANTRPESASSTTTPATPSKDSEGLSTGAKAGIGIAVALGFLFILALGAFFYWRRRRAQTQETVHTEKDLMAPEVYNSDLKAPPIVSQTAYEMHAPVSELPASSDYSHHELPGRGTYGTNELSGS